MNGLKATLFFLLLMCTVSVTAQKAIFAGAATAGFVQLPGHVAPIVRRSPDAGRANVNLRLDHMELQLKRSPEKEVAAEAMLAALQDPNSPSYHKWLTATEFGERFGVDDQKVASISTWLRQSGFDVEGLNDARNTIQFSGSVDKIEHAFHTEMHYVQTKSGQHLTNISLPSVPAEFADSIAGVPLSDFKPHPLYRAARSVQRSSSTGAFTQVGAASKDVTPGLTTVYGGDTYQLVTPADFALIYNLTPVWNAGYRGKGQTIAVVEDTLMNAPDVATFRKAFGLSAYAGTFSQGSPAGSHPCTNPGITGDSVEAALDAQWAGATAPDAAIYLGACANTQTQFGGLLAVMNLLSQKTPPQEISMSYGFCEAEMGTIQLKQYSLAFQQAVAEGVAIFVSSGDEGPASCDADQSYAVSGYTSTPYDVSVGGTDFFDVLQGTTSQYWSATNSSTYESALSYVPEKTWNSSCADSDLLANEGASTAYGANGFCNVYPGYEFVTTASGSGGPSSYFQKPAWQSVNGNPADNARDIPDVSLFAASGFYGHALVFCDTQKKFYGVPCNYSNPMDAVYDSAGGTSFASPALAGVFSLITQKYGRQGNPNVGFYALAAKQYGTTAAPVKTDACDSTLGKNSPSTCVFHDVTPGSIDVPCLGSNSCYGSVSSSYIYAP
jgi:subtilase family serine protease